MQKSSSVIPVIAVTVGAGIAAGIIAYRNLKYPGVKLNKSIIVDRSPAELYRYWRNSENLTRFMEILESVEVLNLTHSRWTIAAPRGLRLSWTAKITVDRKNEMIGWRSIEGSSVDTAGYVRFERAPGGRGTMVRLALQYNPRAGKIAAAVASVLGKRPGAHIEETLRRFKQFMEAGEIATVVGRPSIQPPAQIDRLTVTSPAEEVESASEDSFPASDPPAWTGTGI